LAATGKEKPEKKKQQYEQQARDRHQVCAAVKECATACEHVGLDHHNRRLSAQQQGGAGLLGGQQLLSAVHLGMLQQLL
jgi:hypothetical protein